MKLGMKWELNLGEPGSENANIFCVAELLFKPWLHVKQNYFEIILKLFRCLISHATTSETEIKLFQPLKEL